MHATKTPNQLYSMSPVDTQRNDPLTCNRKNPRKTTTIYIYRIKCPAYISNNVTTTQVQSVSKLVLYKLISEASTNEPYKSSEMGVSRSTIPYNLFRINNIIGQLINHYIKRVHFIPFCDTMYVQCIVLSYRYYTK